VWFSPKGGCADAVVDQVKSAKKTLDIQAYEFTNLAIAKAVGEAQERGVKVRAILDEKASGQKYSSATYLRDHGVATFTDGEHPIAHNKVIIIDGSTLITGSFNFTSAAENSNAENLLVITGKQKLADAYEKNFEAHLKHSKKYEGVKPD
jgi:phosphatidylserine/phosphatidylglycerophosphate/cardiolipin synthase-like enzyme